MNAALLADIFRLTLRNPRAGAERVMALNLPVQGLWIALALVAVLLSLMLSASVLAMPIPSDEMAQFLALSPAYSSPLFFAVLNWAQAVIWVFAILWAGRMFGGQGEFADVLAVAALWQVMSFVLFMVIFLITAVLPFVALLAMLVFVVWLLWASVSFVGAAHRVESAGHAAGIWFAALMGTLIASMILSTVLGGLAFGRA